eukprot:3710509-Rhodomonas_salina.1
MCGERQKGKAEERDRRGEREERERGEPETEGRGRGETYQDPEGMVQGAGVYSGGGACLICAEKAQVTGTLYVCLGCTTHVHARCAACILCQCRLLSGCLKCSTHYEQDAGDLHHDSCSDPVPYCRRLELKARVPPALSRPASPSPVITSESP